jgi:hypothetical protein
MKQQNESPAGQGKGNQIQVLSRHEDTKSYRIKQHLRKILREGGHFTAVELNALTGQNDSRKRLSEMRREGMNIASVWLDGHKIYWLVPDDQPTLFSQGGATV